MPTQVDYSTNNKAVVIVEKDTTSGKLSATILDEKVSDIATNIGTYNKDAILKSMADAPPITTGGSSSQSSRGGKSRKGKKSKGGKSRKGRKSLRRK
jgi:hypothetical protein